MALAQLLWPSLALASILITTYHAVFNNTSTALWIVNYLLDAAFWAAMISVFVRHRHRAKVYPVSHHAANGTSDSLIPVCDVSLMTVAACIPIELFGLLAPNPLNVVAFMRCNRILHYVSVHKMVAQADASLIRNQWGHLLAKFAVNLGLSVHLIACAWFLVADCGSWQAVLPDSAGVSPPTLYLWSVYWSVLSITTTGYGDVHAVSAGEKWSSVGVMLYGTILLGYLLGTLASMLSNIDAPVEYFRQSLSIIATRLQSFPSLPAPLRDRCIASLVGRWNTYRQISPPEFLEGMPASMRRAIMHELHGSVFHGQPLYESLHPALLRELSSCLEHATLPPGVSVAARGAAVEHVYFLLSGSLSSSCGQRLIPG